MKKLFTLFIIAVIAIITFSAKAQINYIENWEGNGATGTGSKPTDFGWGCTYASTSWNTANTSPGVRYQDVTSGYTYNGSAWTGRVLLVRWDSGQSTSDYFYYPMNLTACTSYTLDFKYIWWNNSTQPTYTYGISTSNTTSSIFLKSDTAKASAAKTVFKRKTLTFTAPTTGTYYFLIKSSTAVLGAVSDMFITQNSIQTLSVNQTSLVFDKFNPIKTFTVTGNALSDNVILSAPAGIQLDKTTITAVEAQCGVTVTATYDQTTDINDGSISVSSGTLSQSINTNAVSTNTTNATTAIINPSFEAGFNGWTNIGLQTQSNASFALKDGTYYVEKWQNSGSLSGLRLSQSISNLPNGYYQLSVAAFTQNSVGGAYIFANLDSTQVFDSNNYNVITNITNGTLKIGFSVISSSNWVAADNFKLTYLGTSYLLLTPNSLSFNELETSKTFNVSGLDLTSDVILTPPTGITLSTNIVTAAEANNSTGLDVIATYDMSTPISGATIIATSGANTKTITVNGNNSTDSGCFNPLYTDRTNIIIDPYLNDLANFAGWGTRSIVTDYVYCGARSVKLSGKCGGSLDYGLSGKIETNKNYRVRAMVSTNGTGEAKIGISGAANTTITQPVSTAAGEWLPVDFTFTTGNTLNNPNLYFNSCETQTATEMYIDNWEMYEMPTLNITANNTTNDSILFTSSGQEISVAVTASMFANGFNVSSDNALFLSDVTTLPNTGGNINLTFNGNTSATGNLTISSVSPSTPAPTLRVIGSTSITIPMKATLVPTNTNGLENGLLNIFTINEGIRIKFNLKTPSDIDFSIYSTNGVLISETKKSFSAGSFQEDLKIKLLKGIYLLKITSNGQTITKKIIK